MRFVPLKTVIQQARLSWHRAREGYMTESLAIGNRIRGLLAEFGVVIKLSNAALRRWLADPDTVTSPSELVELIRDLAEHWAAIGKRVVQCDRRIESHDRADERCVRIRSIIGIGPLTADALVATIRDAKEFKNGRQLSAWLGLVPTQHSSGRHRAP